MKSFLFILASMVMVGSGNEWLTDFDHAKNIAKENDKMILLNFSGSDWCAPCIKMKRDVFEKPAFLEYASQNLVLVRADFPRQKKNQLDAQQKLQNEKLADQYNSNGAFPLTLLLDANGKVIQEWNGYQDMAVEEFIKQVDTKVNGK